LFLKKISIKSSIRWSHKKRLSWQAEEPFTIFNSVRQQK